MIRLWIIVGLLVTCCVLVVALWATPVRMPPTTSEVRPRASLPKERSVQAWSEMVSTNFAGDAACQECHPAESAAHRRSGHSRTAQLMADSKLARELHQLGTFRDPKREQAIEFELKGDVFKSRLNFLNPNDANVRDLNVHWTHLMGSGTHAQTAIAVDETGRQGLEARWTSVSREGHRELTITPSHERFDECRPGSLSCFGRPMDAGDVRACLGCHSTVIPPPPLPLTSATVALNVGCERCHGPRKLHVQAALNGMPTKHKPLVNLHDRERSMRLCGECHRDERSVGEDSSAADLARFQPYGLRQSECFKQSETLSCSTCHDPHDTTSKDRSFYNDRCVNCHAQESDTSCPQRLTGDCVACHMPKVAWTRGIGFHDHYIRRPDDRDQP